MDNIGNLDAIALLMALITPYVVAFVNRPQWTRTTKRLIMVGVAVVMAAINALIRGDFDHWSWDGFLPYLVAFIGAVQVLYTGLEAFKPTSVLLDKAEVTFSNVTPVQAAKAKDLVNKVAVQEFRENVGADQVDQPAA